MGGQSKLSNRVATVAARRACSLCALLVVGGERDVGNGMIAKRIVVFPMNEFRRLKSRVTAIALLSLRYTTIAALLTNIFI